jgi:hypothetical protein
VSPRQVRTADGKESASRTAAASSHSEAACPPTGNTIFVLNEIYESSAGVAEHWRLASESWPDLPAFLDWSVRCDAATLHSGGVVQSLW